MVLRELTALNGSNMESQSPLEQVMEDSGKLVIHTYGVHDKDQQNNSLTKVQVKYPKGLNRNQAGRP